MNQVPSTPESDRSKLDRSVTGANSARRRVLLRISKAALPVIATVASKPALAWHCQTTSAWGSELINPNTSLKTTNSPNYTNETWTRVNWKDNTARSAVSGYLPWASLFAKYPALKTAASNSSNNVTIAMLTQYVPGFTNPSCSTAGKLRGTSGILATASPHQWTTIVAQLNYVCLANANSGWGMCVSRPNETGVPLALRQMAQGSYAPPNISVPWGPTEIVTYLQSNYMAVNS